MLAIGALLVTLRNHHVIFAIMTTFTGTSVVYLLITASCLDKARHLIDRCIPPREVGMLPVS